MEQAIYHDKAAARFFPAHPGRSCANCHQPIAEGTLLAWFPGGTTFHRTCDFSVTPAPAAAPVEGRVDPDQTLLRSSVAKFHGRCDGCGERIKPGDAIRFARAVGTFHEGHEELADDLTPVDLTGLPEGTTRYAAEQDGKLWFLRVDRIPFTDAQGVPNKYGGNTYVKARYGGNEWDRIGQQYVGQPYRGALYDALRAIMADPAGSASRYGLELGRCSVCDRDLTDAESRRLGIGPVCRKAYGFDESAPGQLGFA